MRVVGKTRMREVLLTSAALMCAGSPLAPALRGCRALGERGRQVEVLRIENSVDWSTTTIPPSTRRSPDRLGRGYPFPRSTGKVLAVATESGKKFHRGPGFEKRPSFLDKENRQSGRGRGGCKHRGSAGRFQSGVMVVQKGSGPCTKRSGKDLRNSLEKVRQSLSWQCPQYGH
jgi:hypothetical protein